METIQQTGHYPFLQGGGEMGALIRNYDWLQTNLGTPDQWPHTLQVSLANALHSGFPTFLFWGENLTCFYNDAFRRSLGAAGSHPAIGKGGKTIWAEAWDLIGPLIQTVLETGKPVWRENQLIPFNRNGRIEETYWTFSFTALVHNGLAGGVLATCLETTHTVLAQEQLEQRQEELHFALEAGHQGSWQLDLTTYELKASGICKQIFGQSLDQPFSYDTLRKLIHPDDQQRQQEAVMHSINTGAAYDIDYRVIWPDGSLHWVNIRGQVRYNRNNVPESMVGASRDISERKEAEYKLQKSEARFRNMIEQAPVAIALTRGKELIIESINQPMLQLIHKQSKQEVLGKSLGAVLPELVSQPVYDVLQQVLQTGATFKGTELEVELARDGVLQRRYFNVTYSRVVEQDGSFSVLHMSADITEQVVAKRKTEQSEAKLRSILNSAPTAMGVFVGPDLIIENPNQLLIEIMAAGPDIEGKSFRKLLVGLVVDHQEFIALIDGVRTTGKPFNAQEVPVFFQAEQRSRYFNISFIPLCNESGAVYAVLDVSVDVTEQVLTRKKIEESEGRFRLLADASPNLIWMLNADGSYAYVNKTTLQFLNATQEQIAAVGWEAFQHPDDLPAATGAIVKAVQHLEPYHLEHRLRYRDGQFRWVLSQALPAYDANGVVFAYVGSSIDIHETKKNRQDLQTALEQIRLSKEAAELGTFDMDLEEGTMHWDERCRILFGISHNEPVTFEDDFLRGLHPDDRERILAVVKTCFDKSASNGDYDVEYRTIGAEDGTERWVRAKGKVYFNSNDKAVRFVGSVLDISPQVDARRRVESLVAQRTKELGAANQTLSTLNQELQRSNQNLEEFAHAASHDLKEPIRKIHYFTHQLREQLSGQLQEAELRSFSRIENATQRMGNLIDDLLLYSHVSQRPHETEAVDLNEKVQRVLEDLELDIEEKKADIQVGKLPVVQGYRRQLQQLFQNLLSNAIKYSKADVPPQVTITAEPLEKDGRLYQAIKIKDNGIGFEPMYADKIFQMFARLHGKAEYSGTGVGLSIVKKVVENHNGFIEVESEPGEGSTFQIVLPVSQ